MCGIAGFLSLTETEPDRAHRSVRAMTDTLEHRGPDDSGQWVDAGSGIALGHRRLSIVDLSPNGHQPMHSATGRWVVSFNGEIYNFQALRRELEARGHQFRGHCDTEVLLAAVEEWGLEAALERFNGMYAFALWDRRDRVLHLVRDRPGEKPLYYGWLGNVLVFASELKGLRAYDTFDPEIDRDAVTLFLRLGYIPAPFSVYRHVKKLPPGTVLSVSATSLGRQAAPVPYWSARDVVEQAKAAPFRGTPEEAIDQADALLRDAVRIRMEADVPLGAFLSGGIDSSTVVALMQAEASRPVKTFTIGFLESRFDEARFAAKVARHLGTEHTELYVTPSEARTVIPRLPTLYDEPFADVSQIPTFLVSQLARSQVTVSLSGDAGDELFGGYNRYTWGQRIWAKIGRTPRPLRRAVARAMTTVSPPGWAAAFRALGPVLPPGIRNRSDRVHKLAFALGASNAESLYVRLASQWHEPASVVIGGAEPRTILTDRTQWADVSEFIERMMYVDLVTYLPDDILAKVDRATMGVSLEARLPLLDHRVIDFAWRLPLTWKVRGTQGKWLLRQVLYRYVPRELIERPKMGFGVPIGSWLRGDLRDWAEDLIDERRLREGGLFEPRPVRAKWQEHLKGAYDHEYDLWAVLMFQAWLADQRPVSHGSSALRLAPRPQRAAGGGVVG